MYFKDVRYWVQHHDAGTPNFMPLCHVALSAAILSYSICSKCILFSLTSGPAGLGIANTGTAAPPAVR